MRRSLALFSACLALTSTRARAADECAPPLGVVDTEGYTLASSSFLGSAGADSLWAAAILGDGTIVLGGRFAALPAAAEAATASAVFGAGPDAAGTLLMLTPDAQAVLRVVRVGDDVFDLALDAADNLYVALGAQGFGSLDPQGGERWKVETAAAALDAADDGTVGVLSVAFNADHEPAAKGGEIFVFGGDGALKVGPIAGWGGREHTDIAIHDSAERVYVTGFHITSSCKNPVHVAFIRAWDFAGTELWTNYGWAGDDLDPGCSDYEDNNMADTRGYVLAFGADGRLYAGYEAAGGNHIFRYDPRDLTLGVGGLRKNSSLGPHAEMFDTKSEHKTVIGRYDAETGDLMAWQQWVARLGGFCGKEAGNTIRTKRGEIAADAAGRVYLTGASAYGMYMTHDPFLDDPYHGGFYMTVFGPELDMSPYSTRHFGGGQGHTVAVRERPGEPTPMVVFAGRIDKTDFNLMQAAIQDANAGEAEGALVVLNAAEQLEPGTTGEPETTGEPATTGEPPGTGTGGESETGGESGTGAPTTSGGAPTTGGEQASSGGGESSGAATGDGTGEAAGCGCRGGEGGAGTLGVLVLAGLARRRRARSWSRSDVGSRR